MELENKIDVLDLIISVLQEHEKTLDALATRLERLAPPERLRIRAHESI
jgi:hypothetical protein